MPFRLEELRAFMEHPFSIQMMPTQNEKLLKFCEGYSMSKVRGVEFQQIIVLSRLVWNQKYPKRVDIRWFRFLETSLLIVAFQVRVGVEGIAVERGAVGGERVA